MSSPAAVKRPRRSWLPLCLVGLIVLTSGSYLAYVAYDSKPQPLDEQQILRNFLATIPQGQQLDAAFEDADNDLVADRPHEAGKLARVDELAFTLVAGDDPKRAQEDWKDFLAALEKGTGKKVVYRTDLPTEQAQLAALREGKLHITAINTGRVAFAVNTAGFVPLACPADIAGEFAYQMEILVPAASSAKSPADLKGKTIAFTSLSSNSGARAPLVILKDKFGMLPLRDYRYLTTGSHERSLKELAAGKHEAVCVANDLLARAVAAGDIRADQFRSIYKSESFPPLCLGLAHQLPPELATKVKQVFQSFRFEGTSLAKRYGSQGKTGFGLVDYKKDWEYVRANDEALKRLLD